MKKIIALTAALMLANGVFAQEVIRAVKESLGSRTIYVYAPQDIKENRPLLISCHGMGQTPSYQANQTRWEDKADAENFVVVYPQGIGNAWSLGSADEDNFISSIIDEMSKRYKIDLSRVYLSGFSMGGMLTHFSIHNLADKIAAFAPVSGYPIDGENFNYTSTRKVPIMHTNGDGDDVVHFEEWKGTFNGMQQHQMGAKYIMGRWAAYNGCDASPDSVKVGTATRYTWKNCKDGVEVILNRIPGKGHWHSNDAGFHTTNQIWDFVSRFSLKGAVKPIEVTANRDSVFNSAFGDSLELHGWSLNTWSGEATLKRTNGEAEISITKAAESKNYQIQMIQNGLHIENGETYTLTFDAYAAAKRTIEANVEMDDDPWTSFLSEVNTIEIGTEKKTYSITFTMNEATTENGRISFNVGLNDANVFLDNITLKKASAISLEESETDNEGAKNDKTFIGVKFQKNTLQTYMVYGTNGALVGSFMAMGVSEIQNQLTQMGLNKGIYLVRNKSIGFSRILSVK